MTELELLQEKVKFLENIIFQINKSDRFVFEKKLQMLDGRNIQTGKTTGTIIGTEGGASGQKLGFFATTPVVQQTGVAITAAGIHAALVNLGLITA